MKSAFYQRLSASILFFLLLFGNFTALANEATDLLPEDEDGAMKTFVAYVDETSVLLEQPVANAPLLAILPIGSKVLVMAHHGEYVRVNVQVPALENRALPEWMDQEDSFLVAEEPDGGEPQNRNEPVSMEGYILLENLTDTKRVREFSGVYHVVKASVLYTEAHEYASAGRYLQVGSIVQVDGLSGLFSHIKGMGLYVHTATLQKLNAKEGKATSAFWTEEMPLYGIWEEELVPLGTTVPKSTLLEVQWAYRDGYCVFYNGIWGIIAQKNMQKLKAQKLPVALAAVLPKGARLQLEPIADGQTSGETVAEDTPIWVHETVNGHVAMALEGEMLFASYSDLRLLDELQKVTPYEGYVEVGAALLDFPDPQVGAKVGDAPANSLVKISAQNHEYAMIEKDGAKQFIALKDMVSLDALFDDPDQLENYYILLDKAKRELTVFLADEQGNPTDTVLQQAKVAIGRRTQPTPVGVFKLSLRQRWRSFPPRFAPFVIQYTAWNRKLFIHGPMCFHPDDDTISQNALLEFGQQKTSGCIRVPYDMMLWIYCHCGPDNTVMEVVGGRS